MMIRLTARRSDAQTTRPGECEKIGFVIHSSRELPSGGTHFARRLLYKMVVLLGLETAALGIVASRLPAVRATARDTVRWLYGTEPGAPRDTSATSATTRSSAVRSPAAPLRPTILPQLFGHREAATNSVLRHPAILDSVNASVPRRYNGEVGAHWHLLFTTDYDGTSLAHLLHQCASDAAMLVIVRSVDGRVFGAYINELLEATTKNDEWHGTGECFLFALAEVPLPPLPERQLSTPSPSGRAVTRTALLPFRWQRGSNSQFVRVDATALVIGAGGTGGVGLLLDSDLCRGASGHTATFGNPPLPAVASVRPALTTAPIATIALNTAPTAALTTAPMASVRPALTTAPNAAPNAAASGAMSAVASSASIGPASAAAYRLSERASAVVSSVTTPAAAPPPRPGTARRCSPGAPLHTPAPSASSASSASSALSASSASSIPASVDRDRDRDRCRDRDAAAAGAAPVASEGVPGAAPLASEGVPEGSIEFDVAVVESALHACAQHGAPIEFDVAVVEVWGLDERRALHACAHHGAPPPLSTGVGIRRACMRGPAGDQRARGPHAQAALLDGGVLNGGRRCLVIERTTGSRSRSRSSARRDQDQDRTKQRTRHTAATRRPHHRTRLVTRCGRQSSPTLLGRVIGHVRFVRFVTNSAGESDRAVDTDSITRARTAQELSATQKTEER
jgi:hypothetical protein